jgi:hypothetical protein
MDSEKYIGLDVHQATIVVAVMEKWIEGRSPGHIAAMREFMKQMSAQLAKAA